MKIRTKQNMISIIQILFRNVAYMDVAVLILG
jgi:hypothetical protein